MDDSIVLIIAWVVVVSLIVLAAKGLWEYYKDIRDTKSGDFLLNHEVEK